MPRINHFVIPGDEPERAIGFYESVLGWRFDVAWEDETPNGRETFWRIHTGTGDEPGIDGGMTRREFPGQGIAVAVDVEDILPRLELVAKHGGKVIVPRVPLPDGSWFALVQDCEGNSFALTEPAKAQSS